MNRDDHDARQPRNRAIVPCLILRVNASAENAVLLT